MTDTKLAPQELKELKKIVLARLQVMPKTINVAVGSNNLTKEELLEHVEKEDEIGKQMMMAELEFLRDLASGKIYQNA